MNELPTIYESVIGNDKNQEVATENAKKRVKDKSTVSYHSSKNSKSNSEVPGKSSGRLVSTRKVLNSAEVTGDVGYKPIKDSKRKWEGTKAITKQVGTPRAKCCETKIEGSWNSNKSTNWTRTPKAKCCENKIDRRLLEFKLEHKLENLQSQGDILDFFLWLGCFC